MTTRSLTAILSPLVLSACTSLPQPLQDVGNAAGKLGSTALDAGKAGVSNLRAAASSASAPEATSATPQPEIKPVTHSPAGVKWDGSYADKFKGQNAVTRAAGNVAWVSPNKEFVAVTIKPASSSSKISPRTMYGQVSVESCDRTLSGTASQASSSILSAVTSAATSAATKTGVLGQAVRQASGSTARPTTATTPSVATLTGAFAGLTDAQKTECIKDISTVKAAVEAEAARLASAFTRDNKGTPYVITYSGTKGADVVLGLTTIAPAPARR